MIDLLKQMEVWLVPIVSRLELQWWGTQYDQASDQQLLGTKRDWQRWNDLTPLHNSTINSVVKRLLKSDSSGTSAITHADPKSGQWPIQGSCDR